MELVNYKQNCRLCLKAYNMYKNVFIHVIEGFQDPLVQIIFSLFKVELDSHGSFPEYVCRKCITEVENILLFKEDVIRNQKFLFDLFRNAYPSCVEKKPNESRQIYTPNGITFVDLAESAQQEYLNSEHLTTPLFVEQVNHDDNDVAIKDEKFQSSQAQCPVEPQTQYIEARCLSQTDKQNFITRKTTRNTRNQKIETGQLTDENRNVPFEHLPAPEVDVRQSDTNDSVSNIDSGKIPRSTTINDVIVGAPVIPQESFLQNLNLISLQDAQILKCQQELPRKTRHKPFKKNYIISDIPKTTGINKRTVKPLVTRDVFYRRSINFLSRYGVRTYNTRLKRGKMTRQSDQVLYSDRRKKNVNEIVTKRTRSSDEFVGPLLNVIEAVPKLKGCENKSNLDNNKRRQDISSLEFKLDNANSSNNSNTMLKKNTLKDNTVIRTCALNGKNNVNKTKKILVGGLVKRTSSFTISEKQSLASSKCSIKSELRASTRSNRQNRLESETQALSKSNRHNIVRSETQTSGTSNYQNHLSEGFQLTPPLSFYQSDDEKNDIWPIRETELRKELQVQLRRFPNTSCDSDSSKRPKSSRLRKPNVACKTVASELPDKVSTVSLNTELSATTANNFDAKNSLKFPEVSSVSKRKRSIPKKIEFAPPMQVYNHRDLYGNKDSLKYTNVGPILKRQKGRNTRNETVDLTEEQCDKPTRPGCLRNMRSNSIDESQTKADFIGKDNDKASTLKAEVPTATCNAEVLNGVHVDLLPPPDRIKAEEKPGVAELQTEHCFENVLEDMPLAERLKMKQNPSLELTEHDVKESVPSGSAVQETSKYLTKPAISTTKVKSSQNKDDLRTSDIPNQKLSYKMTLYTSPSSRDIKAETISTLEALNERYEIDNNIGLRMKLRKMASCERANSLKYDTQVTDDDTENDEELQNSYQVSGFDERKEDDKRQISNKVRNVNVNEDQEFRLTLTHVDLTRDSVPEDFDSIEFTEYPAFHPRSYLPLEEDDFDIKYNEIRKFSNSCEALHSYRSKPKKSSYAKRSSDVSKSYSSLSNRKRSDDNQNCTDFSPNLCQRSARFKRNSLPPVKYSPSVYDLRCSVSPVQFHKGPKTEPTSGRESSNQTPAKFSDVEVIECRKLRRVKSNVSAAETNKKKPNKKKK